MTDGTKIGAAILILCLLFAGYQYVYDKGYSEGKTTGITIGNASGYSRCVSNTEKEKKIELTKQSLGELGFKPNVWEPLLFCNTTTCNSYDKDYNLKFSFRNLWFVGDF